MTTGQHPKPKLDDELVYPPVPMPVESKEIRSALVHFTPVGPGGEEGMTMILTPAVQVQPGQWVPTGVQVSVPFDEEGWAKFQAQVAADGRVPKPKEPSRIEVAHEMPPERTH